MKAVNGCCLLRLLIGKKNSSSSNGLKLIAGLSAYSKKDENEKLYEEQEHNITSLAIYTNFSVPLLKNAYLLSLQRKASHS